VVRGECFVSRDPQFESQWTRLFFDILLSTWGNSSDACYARGEGDDARRNSHFKGVVI
jgi:hypothetical protein